MDPACAGWLMTDPVSLRQRAQLPDFSCVGLGAAAPQVAAGQVDGLPA